MKKSGLKKFFLILTLLAPMLVVAFPLSEKRPDTEVVPLNILSAQPEKIFLPTFGDFKDALLFTVSSTTLTIIDTTTWDEYTTQPDAFPSAVVDVGLLANGTTLVAALASGNLARIELDDEDTFANTVSSDDVDEDEDNESVLDDRVTNVSDNMTTAGISHMVVDDEDDTAYMVSDDGFYFEYNFDTQDFIEIELLDSDGTAYTPTDILFAASSDGDKVLISTDTNVLLQISPGSGSYSEVTLTSTADAADSTPSFLQMALTQDGDFAYIIDSANDVIWVYSLQSETFEDQISSGTSLDPITVDSSENTTFSDITIYEENADFTAYVSGASGITLMDASNPETAEDTKIIDADDSTSGSENPITVSATPGLLAASSEEDGIIYSANADATISVFTENPFVSITEISPSSVTGSSSTFSLTFQADSAGTYTVKANSNPSGSQGTELLDETELTTADTATTTENIDINSFERTTFVEGTNKIFVFVTDSEDRTGRSAIYLTVDRPPEELTITGGTFGSSKAYLTFEASTDEDIDYYSIFAEPAASQSSPDCPGSLTFESSNTSANSLQPTECTGSLCTGIVTNLTNDITYCLAVYAVDLTGQQGTLATFATAITPEQTVGPAGFLGETDCSLGASSNTRVSVTLLLVTFLILGTRRFFYRKKTSARFFLILLFFFLPTLSHAQERTPQNWTIEGKGSLWIPTDSGMKTFFNPCCNFGGEVEFGILFRNHYNITLSSGFGYKSGDAVGATSGLPSGDSFTLLTFPVRLDFIYRFDFKTEQLFLPYLRGGMDAVIFREVSGNSSTNGAKYGLHAGAGFGFLLDHVENLTSEMENDMGINDIYLVLEGRYAFINSFKSTGLDLSGFYPYLGVLFEF